MNLITPIFTQESTQQLKSLDFAYVKSQLEMLESMMSTRSLNDNLTLSVENAKLDRRLVSKYEAKVVGRFYLGEDLILSLADGYHVNVSEMVRHTLEVHVS